MQRLSDSSYLYSQYLKSRGRGITFVASLGNIVSSRLARSMEGDPVLTKASKQTNKKQRREKVDV